MCGIVGIVKLNPQAAVDEVGLKRMRDVLRHRGPDGEGLWVEGPVGLGHRRLAIVDVAGGQQPMPNEEDRKSTRLNSSHVKISYAVFCLKKKKKKKITIAYKKTKI